MTEQILILWSTMTRLRTITAAATNCLRCHLPYGENIYNCLLSILTSTPVPVKGFTYYCLSKKNSCDE